MLYSFVYALYINMFHKYIYIYKRRKKVKLINHDCLPILMLLYIMHAYLMLFAALSNAACLYNVFFFFCH